MEVSSPCNGGPSELLVRRLGSKKIYASRNQRGNRNSDTEESLIAKFGNALRAFLHVKDAQQQFSDCNSLPSKDSVLQYPDSNIPPSKDAQLQFPDINILPSEDAQLQCTLSAEFNLDQPKLCEDAQLQCTLSAEFNLDQPKLSTTPPIEDVLNKHGDEDCAEITPLMISSENAPSMVVSVEQEEEILDSVSLFPSEEHSGGLVCEPQPSLPVALVPTKELISAMKGTREKLGIMPLTKLTVTWSPDVYDPPVTSVTHTVTGRNHHHRSRSKKTNTTSKRHKGGKSSQGSSSSSKRHHKHASKSDHHHCSKSSSSSSSSSSPPSSSSSSPVSTSERSVFGCYESMLDDLDLESTCGSSFLGKSVAEVLVPFAEAK